MAAILKAPRVLIVEDEAITAYYEELLLAKAGYEVVGPIEMLEQALAEVETGGFDAVLLDVNLHGEWSYPVADLLCKRGLPFLFMTAYGHSQIAEAYHSYPCCQKTAGSDSLLDMLSQVLADREPRRGSAGASGTPKA
jgi:CheY-like chemotaxis protein